MYSTCIFCSAALGRNEAVEAFPVGRSLAFDAWKGRLWAVCPRCGRWNLAPLEERWEAVEEAEKRFADTRLRVQSENVGLAKLRDGTRLIRVGAALPGELAAWRYGDQLVRRRRRYLLLGAATIAGGLALGGGVFALGVGGSLAWTVQLASRAWRDQQQKRVVYRIPAARSPSGREVVIRRWHVHAASLGEGESWGGVRLYIPEVDEKRRPRRWDESAARRSELALGDDLARQVLGRAMVVVNASGASRARVGDAVRLLADSGSAAAYLTAVGRNGRVLGSGTGAWGRPLAPVGALALEMALHEEQERRALEGELAALEAAWREAEEIAGIADALPDDPLGRLLSRRPG